MGEFHQLMTNQDSASCSLFSSFMCACMPRTMASDLYLDIDIDQFSFLSSSAQSAAVGVNEGISVTFSRTVLV